MPITAPRGPGQRGTWRDTAGQPGADRHIVVQIAAPLSTRSGTGHDTDVLIPRVLSGFGPDRARSPDSPKRCRAFKTERRTIRITDHPEAHLCLPAVSE